MSRFLTSIWHYLGVVFIAVFIAFTLVFLSMEVKPPLKIISKEIKVKTN